MYRQCSHEYPAARHDPSSQTIDQIFDQLLYRLEGPGNSHTGLGSLCSQAGTVGLVLASAIGFIVRLVFRPRITREAQTLVRTAIPTVFHGIDNRDVGMTAFTIMSALRRIATIVWLARYRAA